LLKNVKSVRLFKIIKLLKLLRITKAYTFMNMSAFWDTEIGREIMQFSKKHKGLYQLAWIILSLMIVTHYYTIMFYFIQDFCYTDSIVSLFQTLILNDQD